MKTKWLGLVFENIFKKMCTWTRGCRSQGMTTVHKWDALHANLINNDIAEANWLVLQCCQLTKPLHPQEKASVCTHSICAYLHNSTIICYQPAGAVLQMEWQCQHRASLLKAGRPGIGVVCSSKQASHTQFRCSCGKYLRRCLPMVLKSGALE